MSRRGVLRGAAATGIGAVAGVVLASAPAAHAASGNPVVMGAANDAGTTSTSLASTTNANAFVVSQNGASGGAVKAVVTNGTGSAIVAAGMHSASTSPVVQTTATGSGDAVYALANGTGRGVVAYVASPSSTASAVYGSTGGTGAGIEGKSTNGRGGKFTGRFAQITLAPGTSSTHPSHGGILGDLYVDLSARLWFCKGSNAWVQVV